MPSLSCLITSVPRKTRITEFHIKFPIRKFKDGSNSYSFSKIIISNKMFEKDFSMLHQWSTIEVEYDVKKGYLRPSEYGENGSTYPYEITSIKPIDDLPTTSDPNRFFIEGLVTKVIKETKLGSSTNILRELVITNNERNYFCFYFTDDLGTSKTLKKGEFVKALVEPRTLGSYNSNGELNKNQKGQGIYDKYFKFEILSFETNNTIEQDEEEEASSYKEETSDDERTDEIPEETTEGFFSEINSFNDFEDTREILKDENEILGNEQTEKQSKCECKPDDALKTDFRKDDALKTDFSKEPPCPDFLRFDNRVKAIELQIKLIEICMKDRCVSPSLVNEMVENTFKTLVKLAK